MPVLRKTLQMAVYNRGVEGICEQYDRYGYVRYLTLLRDASGGLKAGEKEFEQPAGSRIRVFK